MKTRKKEEKKKIKSSKRLLKENLVTRKIDCTLEEFIKRENAMSLEEFRNWCQNLISKYES